MPNPTNLTGQVFGRLTVFMPVPVRANDTRKNRHQLWQCDCDCDNDSGISVPSDRLIAGKTLSCGCLAREIHAAQRDNPAEADRLVAWAEQWRASIRQRHADGRRV